MTNIENIPSLCRTDGCLYVTLLFVMKLGQSHDHNFLIRTCIPKYLFTIFILFHGFNKNGNDSFFTCCQFRTFYIFFIYVMYLISQFSN